MNNLPCDYCNRCSASLRSASDCTIVAGRLSQRQITTTQNINRIMERKNAAGQTFKIESARVLSLVRVNQDGNGNHLETPFVAMLLSNGDGLNAGLSAIGRGISHKVRWEHLSLLKGATVTYCTAERTEGEHFTWRPGDTKELIATSTGSYKSILGIEVRDKYEDAIEALPIYVSEFESESSDDPTDDTVLPTGTTILDEPVVIPDKKGATKK